MKKLCSIFLVLVLGVHTAFVPTGLAQAVLAPSALVVAKETGEVLYGRNQRQARPPASTVKLLTALVILDIMRLDQVVRIHPAALRTQPSRIHLRSGERYYVQDLLKAVLISSANDAARALAIAASASEWKFASRMNAKAAQIGLAQSRFVNASGLPAEGQYATAEDLIKIMRTVEKNDFIMSQLQKKYAVIYNLNGRAIKLKNHNKMLWRDSREILGKTGWTRNAQHCFVGRIRSGEMAVYVVVLGSKNKWNDLSYFADRFVGQVKTKQASVVKNANHGHDVYQIQTALRRAGFFHMKPTGYFGSITKKSLLRFQKAKGLTVDGIVGPETWKELNSYL